jgi:SAM-dependent methyltransferase
MPEKHHDHYEHYSAGMIARLDGFYGRVDARMNQRIAGWVAGERVLDIGCGFGQLVDYLRGQGRQAVGTDMLGECITAGRKRFPKANLRHTPGGGLDFPAGAFDTVILKDTLHHVYAEADLAAFLQQVKRICKQRLIIFDPNPTIFLRLARRIIKHKDPSCPPGAAKKALVAAGFKLVHESYWDVLAFPLSGGFISKPIVKGEGKFVFLIDRFFERMFSFLHLGQAFCWRYLLVADIK